MAIIVHCYVSYNCDVYGHVIYVNKSRVNERQEVLSPWRMMLLVQGRKENPLHTLIRELHVNVISVREMNDGFSSVSLNST